MSNDTTGEFPAVTGSDERQQRLASRVSKLRTRGGEGSLDRWLLIVGGALLPIGILVVVLGWVGASRTPLVFEQIPYLISGGALGTALTFAGGFTYFAYWQTVKVRDGRSQHRELMDALRKLETRLGAVESSNGSSNGSTTRHVGNLVATETGSMVHTRDCPVVSGRDKLVSVRNDGAGMVPCKICDPLGVSA